MKEYKIRNKNLNKTFTFCNYINTDPLISYFIEMVLDKFDL